MTQTANRIGWTDIPVLSELWGLVYDDPLVTALLHSLRPSEVRVIPYGGLETSDAWTWRVTVKLDPTGRIESITQEVEVDLGDHYEHGYAVTCDVRKRLEADW